MGQIYRESLIRFEDVTLDFQIPVWKKEGDKDGQLKRITLKDFFASDLVSSAIDPPNWSTGPLTLSGNITHSLAGYKLTIANGTYEIASTSTFKAEGANVFLPGIQEEDGITKLAGINSSGQVKWKDVNNIINPNAFDKTTDDTDDITEGNNKFVTAGDITKLGHVSVSQAVDLDQLETDVAANSTRWLVTPSNSNNIYRAGTGNVGINTNNPNANLSVDGSAVFNESGNDVNFRIEGANNTNLFFADASEDRVGIGLIDPAYLLDVNGSAQAKDFYIKNTPTNDDTNTNILAWNATTGKLETRAASSIGTSVATNLSEGTTTNTTVDVNSSDGTNATLAAASTSRAGVMSKAKFDEVVANTAKTGITSAQTTKLSGIEAGAEVNPTDSEIETSYNSQVSEVTQAEAEAGTVTTVKRWTPERVKQAIDALAGGTPSLTNGEVFVGNSSNAANSVPMTGDVQIAVNGATTIQPDSVTYSKMQDVSQACMLGKTSSGVGQVSEIPIIEQYISNTSATAILLDNTSNWNVNGVYGGSTIAGTYQGQNHVNPNYWFTATDDDVWIRLIRG